MPRHQSWTDEELIAAVAEATCFKQVCDALGLWPGGGTYRTLERHIARLGIDASHLARRLGSGRPTGRRRRFTDDELVAVVAESTSYAEVIRRLGYAVSGGAHRFVVRHIVRLGLDISHFTGQRWARGRRFPGRNERTLEEVMTERSTYPTGRLRRRLLAAGVMTPRCSRCGIDQWHGAPVSLELDHINGNHTDNRLENLRILCLNCHAQTETYGRRRRP